MTNFLTPTTLNFGPDDDKENVPANEVLLIKDAHTYLSNITGPFADPKYEWEVPQLNMENMMSEQLPYIGTSYDGYPIEHIIKTVAGRAILRASLQNRMLRLDHPVFVDAAQVSLEAHNRYAKQLYNKMNKAKQSEQRKLQKSQRDAQRSIIKEEKNKERMAIKEQKDREREQLKQQKRQQKLQKQINARMAKHAKARKAADDESSSDESSDTETLHTVLPQPCFTRC